MNAVIQTSANQYMRRLQNRTTSQLAQGYEYAQYPTNNPARIARAERFINTTGLIPVPWKHTAAQMKLYDAARGAGVALDHTSAWIHRDGGTYLMPEPYHTFAEATSALLLTGLVCIPIPDNFNIYGNGTSSYLITLFRHVGQLKEIRRMLGP